MNIQQKTVRICLLVAVLSGAWSLAVPQLWPRMDSLSNLVSVMVTLPIIIALAFAVNWAFTDDRRN